jgi:hypothetical protein
MQFSHTHILAVNQLVEADFHMPRDCFNLLRALSANFIDEWLQRL